jgi:chaperonin GroES
MRFEPLGDRILIRRVKEEDSKKNGLYLPDTAKEKPQEGEVLAVGQRVSASINPGNRVLFGKYAGTEIKLNDEPMLILMEEEIFGLLFADEVVNPEAGYTGPLSGQGAA